MTFRQWGGDLSGRELVLSVRRLPSFVLSQFQHRLVDGREAVLPTPEQMADDYMGDFYLRLYTDEGRLPIAHWLRSECIREDLLAFLARHHELDAQQLERVRNMATKPSLNYPHDVFAYFQSADLERLYRTNPRWAEMERQVYGDLLVRDHRVSGRPAAGHGRGGHRRASRGGRLDLARRTAPGRAQ